MQTLFQVVSKTGAELFTLEELQARYGDAITGKETGAHLREELRGQPDIKDLCGPMWGGFFDADHKSVFPHNDSIPTGERKPYGSQEPIAFMYIRYETWEAYEMYSR